MKMTTPIKDFVDSYAEKNGVRAHMPGHKGKMLTGCEKWDITEIKGADFLYGAEGIIAQSEKNASKLFSSARTLYSTEGSSLCIRAMLFSVMPFLNERPYILAGRNVHASFVYACAMLDIDIGWLMPENPSSLSLCQCLISPEGLKAALDKAERRPFAVYVTSPDYLGGMLDIAGLSRVCQSFGIPLLVDNAHGAYLKFLRESAHPMDLGASLCCDSAHKTLPVLTGGAYLHISQKGLSYIKRDPKKAMAAFGSTSPSYLILRSLDACCSLLFKGYAERLERTCHYISELKDSIKEMGYTVLPSDPLKLTVADEKGGEEMALWLRQMGIEPEFADRSAVVLMFTPENGQGDFKRVKEAFMLHKPHAPSQAPRFDIGLKQALSVREAIFSESENIPVERSEGRICAKPSVFCPPAVPPVISGEVITAETVKALEYWGIANIDVLKF